MLSFDAGALSAQAAALRDALTERDAQLSEQCLIAAQEEGRLVEQRLRGELKEAETNAGNLAEATTRCCQDLLSRTSLLSELERRLRDVEQRERQLHEQQVQSVKLRECVQKYETESRTDSERLRSELQHAHDAVQDTVSHLRSIVTSNEQERDSLRMRMEDTEAGAKIAEVPRARLVGCQTRVLSLEAAVVTARKAALEQEAEADRLIQRSMEFANVVEAGEEDLELRSELAAREDCVQDLAGHRAQLRQIDHVATGLTTELRTSGNLVADTEAAIANAQSQLLADSPESSTWDADRKLLHTQLTAMREAEEGAMESAVRLQHEVEEFRADAFQSTRCMASDATNLQQHSTSTSAPGAFQDLAAAKVQRCAQLSELQTAYRKRQDEVEASIHKAKLSLDAKDRRLRLLRWRRTEILQDAERCSEGEPIGSAQRVCDLENLVRSLSRDLAAREQEVVKLCDEFGQQKGARHVATSPVVEHGSSPDSKPTAGQRPLPR